MPESQELRSTACRDITRLCEAEGTIADIVKFAKFIRDDSEKILDNPRFTGSIAKRASDLVLVFPVIVSSVIDIKTAIMISKAIERKCVSLLQILFSSINLQDFRDVQNLSQFVNKLHTNMDMDSIGPNMSLDEFITFMDRASKGRPKQGRHESFVINKEAYEAVMAELKEINSVAKTFLNESAISDYSVKTDPYGKPIVSKSASSWAENVRHEFRVTFRRPQQTPETPQSAPNNGANNGNNNTTGTKDKEPLPMKRAPYTKDVADFFSKQLLSSDVTKANELAPTMMVVNFISILDNGGSVNRAGVVGVKAKLYPMESTEILGRLSTKVSDSNTFFNIIQASTKEKSFWKDLIFSFDKLRRDAINLAKGSINAKIFNLLERRAAKANSRFGGGGANPITTLVISQEEVEYLKKYSNINLENPSIISIIMNGYNLMGVVIVDDSTEIARFLYDDGGGVFETLTYRALEKDDSDANYKKIVNLMSKVAR